MEYREDMMLNLEKSPGMCSDRPGTTPKSLDLIVSPTCLREKERAFWRFGAGWWGKEKGTSHISQAARPHFSVQARTVCDPLSGPSASEKFDLTAD